MGRGVWQATIHGVTESWMRLSDVTFFTFTFFPKKTRRWQSKQMKRCPLLYVIKKRQIKTMRYYYTCIRMATTLNTEKPNPDENKETGTLIHYHWQCEIAQPLCETVRQFFIKLHTLLHTNSSRILQYLPKGVESLRPHKNLRTYVYSSFIHNCQNLETAKIFQ